MIIIHHDNVLSEKEVLNKKKKIDSKALENVHPFSFYCFHLKEEG